MKLEHVRDTIRIIGDMDHMRKQSLSFGTFSHYIEELDNASVYARFFSSRVIAPQGDTFVIANIVAVEPGNGFLNDVMPFLKQKCAINNWCLEFENVGNKRLLKHLINEHGFTVIPNTDPVCVIWNKDHI